MRAGWQGAQAEWLPGAKTHHQLWSRTSFRLLYSSRHWSSSRFMTFRSSCTCSCGTGCQCATPATSAGGLGGEEKGRRKQLHSRDAPWIGQGGPCCDTLSESRRAAFQDQCRRRLRRQGNEQVEGEREGGGGGGGGRHRKLVSRKGRREVGVEVEGCVWGVGVGGGG